MKITIEITDIKTACDALNNAIFSYKNTIRAITLGCDLPKQLEPLRHLEDNQLQERYDCIVNIYKQMEEIERELNN